MFQSVFILNATFEAFMDLVKLCFVAALFFYCVCVCMFHYVNLLLDLSFPKKYIVCFFLSLDASCTTRIILSVKIML